MPDNFRDLFTGNLPQGFFDNGSLPDVPYYGDTKGASNKDLIGGALNAGGMFVPGLNVASGLYNFGTNVQPGFDKGQFGNIDTNYQMGGGDSGNFQAPQPSEHDSIMGSQRAGNALYGGGVSGWLGNLLGQAAGGISTWGDNKIEALPDMSSLPSFAPMPDQSYSIPEPYQVQLRNEPTAPMGPINPGPTSDFGAPTIPQPISPVIASSGGGNGGFVPQYGDPNSFGSMGSLLDTFMQGAGFGGAGYGYGDSSGMDSGFGAGAGWDYGRLQSDNNGGWGQ